MFSPNRAGQSHIERVASAALSGSNLTSGFSYWIAQRRVSLVRLLVSASCPTPKALRTRRPICCRRSMPITGGFAAQGALPIHAFDQTEALLGIQERLQKLVHVGHNKCKRATSPLRNNHASLKLPVLLTLSFGPAPPAPTASA